MNHVHLETNEDSLTRVTSPEFSSTCMPTALQFNCRPGAAASAVEVAELVALKEDMDDGDGNGDAVSEIGEADLAAVRESSLPPALKEQLLAASQGHPVSKAPSPPSSRPRTPEVALPAAPSLFQKEEAPAELRPPPPPVLTHPSFPQVPVVSLLQSAAPAGQLRDFPPGGFPGAAPPPFPPCPWFDPSAITKEEVDELRVSFPSLRVCRPAVEGDRNNLAYLTLRNTLIDVYRSNPAQKLTLAECRKHCDGDLAALLRVLSFLERNRLVNFCIDPAAAPSGGITDNRLRTELAKQWGRTPTCTACDRICLYSFYILSPAAYGSSLPLSHLKAAIWCPDCAREAPHNQCLIKVFPIRIFLSLTIFLSYCCPNTIVEVSHVSVSLNN
eukprot:Gregarina_sp_Poly_1__5355@NODE_282_length_10089_cov_123_197964_g244_i0_p2_GENE_NODE_282_length_10089_cov_123_197964_g244_i0NODE_282_length_10089_cov_123_197964_g244_i0_p2_ORF_typecomplete_len386_score51_18SWIRM/PF04433_17/8_9e15_NODE_282_length_10089_cov_123_197964_g244_i081429299